MAKYSRVCFSPRSFFFFALSLRWYLHLACIVWWESISKIFLCVFLNSKCSPKIGDEGSINSTNSGLKKIIKQVKNESFNTNLVMLELSDYAWFEIFRETSEPVHFKLLIHTNVAVSSDQQTLHVEQTETSSTMFSLSRSQQSTFIILYFGLFYCIFLFSCWVLMHYYQTLFVPDWR